MRIAYHPTGAALTTYALNQWLVSAKADIAASPGIVITLDDPKHPYSFGTETIADDRATLAGVPYSRIITTRRRAMLEFNLCTPVIDAHWQAWSLATYGGRFPFVWEEPLTGELIAVKAAVVGMVTRRENYQRNQPQALDLIEWL
jgi:hypothetical protein